VSQGAPRPVLPGLSFLFWVAGGLVLVATIQLFVLTGQTDRFFAWPIAEPLTAAVDGAFYLAAAILLFPAAKARTWSDVRPLAWGVLVISTLKLAATLLHRRVFHFDHGGAAARIAAWGWLVVYAAVPVALAVLIVLQLRTAGAVRAPERPPVAFRWFAGVMAVLLVVIAIALFAAPSASAARWPWPLTDLTARDLAAWFGGIGVLGGLAALFGDPARMRFVWIGSVALTLLQGVALARYPRSVDWGSPWAWLYVALFAGLAAAGLWGVAEARRGPSTG
jgi:hypothetical protein